jgi:hypothetical protein
MVAMNYEEAMRTLSAAVEKTMKDAMDKVPEVDPDAAMRAFALGATYETAGAALMAAIGKASPPVVKVGQTWRWKASGQLATVTKAGSQYYELATHDSTGKVAAWTGISGSESFYRALEFVVEGPPPERPGGPRIGEYWRWKDSKQLFFIVDISPDHKVIFRMGGQTRSSSLEKITDRAELVTPAAEPYKATIVVGPPNVGPEFLLCSKAEPDPPPVVAHDYSDPYLHFYSCGSVHDRRCRVCRQWGSYTDKSCTGVVDILMRDDAEGDELIGKKMQRDAEAWQEGYVAPPRPVYGPPEPSYSGLGAILCRMTSTRGR